MFLTLPYSLQMTKTSFGQHQCWVVLLLRACNEPCSCIYCWYCVSVLLTCLVGTVLHFGYMDIQYCFIAIQYLLHKSFFFLVYQLQLIYVFLEYPVIFHPIPSNISLNIQWYFSKYLVNSIFPCNIWQYSPKYPVNSIFPQNIWRYFSQVSGDTSHGVSTDPPHLGGREVGGAGP